MLLFSVEFSSVDGVAGVWVRLCHRSQDVRGVHADVQPLLHNCHWHSNEGVCVRKRLIVSLWLDETLWLVFRRNNKAVSRRITTLNCFTLQKHTTTSSSQVTSAPSPHHHSITMTTWLNKLSFYLELISDVLLYWCSDVKRRLVRVWQFRIARCGHWSRSRVFCILSRLPAPRRTITQTCHQL